jgi:hypothetical protein
MSSNENDQKQKKPPPSFSGNVMPDNVCLTMDDGGEEVTRRVGAASFQPSFEPMTSFEPPSLSRFGQPDMSNPGASSIATLPGKSQVKPNERVRARPSDEGRWNLVDVPTLPQFHPLERTAVLVPHATSSEVSTRISDVLRDRSIEAFYEDEKAKVKCTTPDGVNFRVRLYRGRGEFNHGIIVEVQRRFGVSMNFHSDTNAILDAAQGKVPPPPPSSISGNLPLVSDSEDDFETDGTSSLAMVSTMLKHPGYDSQYLALQTLSSLTNSSKMGASTARKVSLELLKPDNEVGSKVLALVVDKKEEDYMFNLQVLAMSVLANAIQAVNGVVSDFVRENLRPVLLEALRHAESNPRSAQMAARCVEFLMDGDHDIGELHEVLETALESGKARHAGLMRQAQVCLDKINGEESR